MIGRSNLVGKPMAQLLLGAERDRHRLPLAHPRPARRSAARADVLVAAVGRPRMVGADWVKPGATVIDVGINRTDDGLVGDVDFDAVAPSRRRDHAGPGRRRPDDDRVPAAQHAQGRADGAPGEDV